MPPWDLEPLIFVALVPWLRSIDAAKTTWAAIVQGFWLAFLATLATAYWFAVALHEFAGLPWPLSILGLLAFAAFCAQPQFVLFAGFVRYWSVSDPIRFGIPTCVLVALSYVGLDAALPRLFDVGLGYALHSAPNLRQLADLAGVAGLTFVIVLVNLLLWQLIGLFSRQRSAFGPWTGYALAIGILLSASTLYGALRNNALENNTEATERFVEIAVVQGSVSNATRLAWAAGDDAAADRQLSTYLDLSAPVVARHEKPDLIVWPEATFPGIFLQPRSKSDHRRATQFDRMAMRLETPLVFGAYDLETIDGRARLLNTIFSVTPNEERRDRIGAVQRYHKSVLLPIAEQLPRMLDFDGVRRIMPTLGNFHSGPGPRILSIKKGDGNYLLLGPILCSEALATDHVLGTARLGAEVLLNVGSDGWFGPYGEPEFHLAISKLRSIETRRPQVRSTNSGLSALILPNGQVVSQTRLNEARMIEFQVPLTNLPATLMSRWGDWFGRAALLLAGFSLITVSWVRRRRRSEAG